MSFMDLQVHLLTHLVDEVELGGMVSCHWMFFLEKYMQKMNEFVRQREELEGSVVEAYIVYELFYSAGINKINDTLGIVVWDEKWMRKNGKGSYFKQMEICAR